MAENTIRIIHAVKIWLPQTMTWLFNQIRALPPEIESHVVCEGVSNLDQFPSENIIRPESASQLFLKRVSRFLGYRWDGCLEQAIRRIKPDILHSHFGNFGWANTKIAKKYGIKHIVTFYGMDVRRLPAEKPIWKTRYVGMFRNIDEVLCEGPFMAECIGKLGCPESKIRVHRLGIDLSLTPFRNRKWHSGETLKFLIVGGFREKKGIPYALEAVGKLKESYENISVTIIGDAVLKDEKIEKKKILDTVAKFEMTGNVRFMGFQPYHVMLKEFYNHHIFISPSITASNLDTEGGAPVTIMEAAASGMPVVSTRHCDIPNVLGKKNADLLADEKDVGGLVNALKYLMKTDWEPIAAENRRHIEEHHDSRVVAEKLRKIYQS